MTTLEKLTSSIYNNVMSGLRGVNINSPFTLEQIEDEVVLERLTIIKEYSMKNLVPKKDLLYAIRCIEVDCESLDRCPCIKDGTMAKHIMLPQTFNDLGDESIDYIGSTDGLVEYKIYTDDTYKLHQYRRRGAEKPYVWVDTTPNSVGFYDAFIFNAPIFLTKLMARVIPKDLRQLREYGCCNEEGININFIDGEIEKRVTEKYIRWYRQTALAITPNDQTVKV